MPSKALKESLLQALPKGWVKTTLGEVCAKVASIRPEESPNTEFTYFDIGGIDNQNNRIVETKTILGRQAPSRARQSVRRDDILFSTVRTYLKKIARIEQDYPNPVASTGFTVIRATEGVSPLFLFSQVLSEKFLQSIHTLQTGSSYPAVRDNDVFAQPIWLAPIREQERIVAKLDILLSRVAAGEAAARRALERLKHYRATVLKAAVTGELTHSWRKTQKSNETGIKLLNHLLANRRARWEEAELKRLIAVGKPPKDSKWKDRYPEPASPVNIGTWNLQPGWAWVSPEQLSDGTKNSLSIGPFGSNLKVSDYRDAGVPLVFVRNIRSESFSEEKGKYVSYRKAEELAAHQIVGGDLLVTKMGDPPGDACIYPDDAPAAIITADCIRLHLSEPLRKTKKFFVYCINSELGREQFQLITSGVAQQKVSLERFVGIGLPLPPVAEQMEINRQVELRLSAADKLVATLNLQLQRAQVARQSLLNEAFSGGLVLQDPDDEPATVLLERIHTAREQRAKVTEFRKNNRIKSSPKIPQEAIDMSQQVPTLEDLQKAWEKIGKKPDANRLFEAAGFIPGQVTSFYETLRSASKIVEGFKAVSLKNMAGAKILSDPPIQANEKPGKFRLVSLWLENFKNLKDYEICFDSEHGLDIVLGWNGTGKSNLFEALVIIFRDLHYWWEKNKWPDGMTGYRLRYEIENNVVEVKWNPLGMKRPEVVAAAISHGERAGLDFKLIKRENLLLPKFIFGYYSGPTNRLADHFWPMKRDHYDRLRKASSDDPATLAELLEQRRFFCAEASHAKYVLLAFSHKEDPKIWKFLEDRLRIVGFESALFVIRKPRWAKGTPEDFWGATGIMRRVMEKLRNYAIAPMVLTQKVADGYRLPSEELYYFFLPDLKSLHSFAAEYADARSFFLALESTEFSELIYDVRIQVRVKAADQKESLVTFRELSEGEQQLLMVLGLMRFTKSHQSLVLLDEPDTHLNPHWSVEYLKDLTSVVSDDSALSPEQYTSQLLMATHDPLVIASLVKEQIHLLKRDRDSLRCYWKQATEDPRGLGYTGILLSDMFGFHSDLDEETLSLLDRQVQLAAKPGNLTAAEKDELAILNKQVEVLGFKTVSSDPYYRSFIEALARRQEALALVQKPTQTLDERNAIRKAADEILAGLVEKHALSL